MLYKLIKFCSKWDPKAFITAQNTLNTFLAFRLSLRLETHKEQNSSKEIFELWNRLVYSK